jgi:mannitol-1-phosphate 5-dehydrogenase
MSKIVVFGAGNIGRSFVGQVFARSGWEVVFSDVDAALVAEINKRREYAVVVKREGQPDEEIVVRGVRAVDGRDLDAVSGELADADLASTSVGKAALPKVLPAIARGLLSREKRAGGAHAAVVLPLDLVIAENDREARETIRSGLAKLLPEGFPLGRRLGLVETSIGKMVPIMRAEDLAVDRLRVFAEAYNDLIVDGAGFLGPVPSVKDLVPVDDIEAYVDRKLFVHNLGHAAVAYLGFRADPSEKLICRALRLPGVRAAALLAMRQAAAALALEYPADLAPDALAAHIDDLLERFGNSALGDTVFRVGRDLRRKLARSDRVLGAAILCERHGLPWGGIADVFSAALGFDARDEKGEAFTPDVAFRDVCARDGIDRVLGGLCGLDGEDPVETRVRRALVAARS